MTNLSRDTKIEMQSINDNEFIIFTTDLKGVITYCNEFFLKTFDTKSELVINKLNFTDFKHPTSVSLIYKDMFNELEEKGQWDGFLNKISNTNEIWLDTYIIVSKKGDEIVGYTGLAKLAGDFEIEQAKEQLVKKYGNMSQEG